MGLSGFLFAAISVAIFSSSKAVPAVPGTAASIIPVPQAPSTYAFGYDVNDGFGMTQHRHESLDTNGIVEGSYGYTDPLGVYRRVAYTADAAGFRPSIRSNEPGMANANPADSIFVVEPPPAAAVAQGIRLISPVLFK